MIRLSPLLFRRLHKWTGLVLGAQLLIWTVSGFMMAALDMELVAGGRAVELAQPPLPKPGGAWERLRRSPEGQSVERVGLHPMAGRYVYEVTASTGTRLFDAESGRPVSIDADAARRIAIADYRGAGSISSISRLEAVTLAVRDHQLPIWKVEFGDQQGSTIYISGTNGRVLERRNDSWRWWDFFWMLHSMDYAHRTNFNHPLIVTLAIGAVWLAFTGIYLLVKTSWSVEGRFFRRRIDALVPGSARRTGA